MQRTLQAARGNALWHCGAAVPGQPARCPDLVREILAAFAVTAMLNALVGQTLNFISPIPHLIDMSNFTALAALRQKTGLSLSLCKEAIARAGNNAAHALEIARQLAVEKGLNVSGNPATSTQSEGLVGIFHRNNWHCAFRLRCLSDFVARSPIFGNLATGVSDQIFDGQDTSKMVAEAMGVLQEPIALDSETVWQSAPNSHSSCFVHSTSPLPSPSTGAVVGHVELLCDSADTTLIKDLTRKLAQQIVGINPGTVSELLSSDFLMTANGAHGESVRQVLERTLGKSWEIARFMRLSVK